MSFSQGSRIKTKLFCFSVSVFLILLNLPSCSNEEGLIIPRPEAVARPFGSSCELVSEPDEFEPTTCQDAPESPDGQVPEIAEGREGTSSAGVLTLGQASVQKQTGALRYSLSIPGLPVAGGLKPELSLEYSSDEGLESAGLGFSLSASHGLFGSIRRCGKNMVDDGANEGVWHVDVHEGYCYEGQKLRLKERYENGWVEYRIEDKPFLKIWSVPFDQFDPDEDVIRNISHFMMMDHQSGLIREFGGTDNSRIGGFVRGFRRLEEEVRVEVPYVYAVSKVADRDGNAATVRYGGRYNEALRQLDGGVQLLGATFYPWMVTSGSKHDVNLIEEDGEIRGAQIGEELYAGRTRFQMVYEELEHRSTSGFIGGQKVERDVRVSRIDSKLRDEENENVWRTVRKTILTYGSEDRADMLHQVKHCVVEQGRQVCSRPLEFEWTGSSYRIVEEGLDVSSGALRFFDGAGEAPMRGDSTGYSFADMDGDGYVEGYRIDPTSGLVKAANVHGDLQAESVVPVELVRGMFEGADPRRLRYWGGYMLCHRGVCRGPESPFTFIDDDGDGRDELYIVGEEHIERVNYEGGRYVRESTGLSHELERWVYGPDTNPGYQPVFVGVKGGGESSLYRLQYRNPDLVDRYVTAVSLRSLKRFRVLDAGEMFEAAELVSIPNARERDIFWIQPLGGDGDGDGVTDFVGIGRDGQLCILSYQGGGLPGQFRVTEVRGIDVGDFSTAVDEEIRRASEYYRAILQKRMKWVDANADGLLDAIGFGGENQPLRTFINQGEGAFYEIEEPMAEGHVLRLYGIDRNSSQANTALSFEEGQVVDVDVNHVGGQLIFPCGSGRANDSVESYCLVKYKDEKWHVEDLAVAYRRPDSSNELTERNYRRQEQREYLAERYQKIRKLRFVDLDNDGLSEMLHVMENGGDWNVVRFEQRPWKLSGASVMNAEGQEAELEQFSVNYGMLGESHNSYLYVPESNFGERVDGRPFLPIRGAGKNVVSSLMMRDGRIDGDGRYGQSVLYYSYGTGFIDVQRGLFLGFDQVEVRSSTENVWSKEESGRMLVYNEDRKRFLYAGLVTHTGKYVQQNRTLIQTEGWDVGEIDVHTFEGGMTYGLQVQAGTTKYYNVDEGLGVLQLGLNAERAIGHGMFDVRRGPVLKTERSSKRYDERTGKVEEENHYVFSGDEEVLEQHNTVYSSYDGEERNAWVDYLRMPDVVWNVRRGLDMRTGQMNVKQSGERILFRATDDKVREKYSHFGTRENMLTRNVVIFTYDNDAGAEVVACGINGGVTRGHLVRTEVKTSQNADAPGYQERVSVVQYDMEGFMPIASFQVSENAEGDEVRHVTTFRNDRKLGAVEAVRDPNGVQQWTKRDGWGRALWTASSNGSTSSIQHLNSESVPQGDAKFPPGLSYWTHTVMAGGGESYVGHGIMGNAVYQLGRRYVRGEDAWVASVTHAPFEEPGQMVGTERRAIQIGPFDPEQVQVIVSSDVQDTFGPGYRIELQAQVGMQSEETDVFGRTRAKYLQDGSMHSFSFRGFESTKIDGRGEAWVSRSNARGQVECIREPDVGVVDALEEIGIPDEGFQVPQNQFEQNRVEEEQCDLSYVYDADGNAVEINARGVITTQGFDAHQKKLWLVDEVSGRTSFTYNAFGELSTSVDGAGRVTTVRHDRLGRKVSQSVVGTQGGQAVRREDRFWRYDEAAFGLGQLSSKHHETDRVSTEYLYDNMGRVHQTKTTLTPLGSVDEAGDELTESYCKEIGYDEVGRVREVRKSGWGMIERYGYDGQTGVHTDIWALPLSWGADARERLFLQHVWQLESQDIYGQPEEVLLGNGLRQKSKVHAMSGRLREIKTYFDEEEDRALQHWSFVSPHLRDEQNAAPAYDGEGNLQYAENMVQDKSHTYLYDPLSRLVGVFHHDNMRGTQLERYQYDGRGNRLRTERSSWRQFVEIGPNDNVLEVLAEVFNPELWAPEMVKQYRYDDGRADVLSEVSTEREIDGQMQEEFKSYTYTELGHASQINQTTLEYSLLDKPMLIESAGEEGGSTVHEFLYDASGQRVQKRWYGVMGGAADLEGDKITVAGIERIRNAAGQWVYQYHIPTPSHAAVQYEIVLPEEGGAEDNVRPEGIHLRYLLMDRLGSVEHVVNDAGIVLETREYGLFGEVEHIEQFERPEDAIDAPLSDAGYTAHEMDWELDMVNMGARMLDQAMGRSVQADSVIPTPHFSQAYNRYAYTYNNPIKYTDPSGNIPMAGFSPANEWMVYAPSTGAPGFGMDEKVFRHHFENTRIDNSFQFLGYSTEGPHAGKLDYDNPSEYRREAELMMRITFAGMKAGSARMRNLFMNLYHQPGGEYTMVFIDTGETNWFSPLGWVEAGWIKINLTNPHMGGQGWFESDLEYGFRLLETVVHEGHHVGSVGKTGERMVQALTDPSVSSEKRWENALIANYAEEALGFAATESMREEFFYSGITEVIDYSPFTFFFDGGFPSRQMVYRDIFDRHSDTIGVFGDTRYIDSVFAQTFIEDALKFRASPILRRPLGWVSAYYGVVVNYAFGVERNVANKYHWLNSTGKIPK